MASKSKSKPRGANRYTPPQKSAAPNWIWLVAGIFIGGFIMFLIRLEPNKDIRQPNRQPTAQQQTHQSSTHRPKFDFPEILSGKEPITLTEEQRKALDAKRAADILEGRTPTVVTPPATNVTTPNTAPSTPHNTANTANTNVTPQPPATTVEDTPTAVVSLRYFLQIGSYPNKQGAERIRAQILMFGQNATIETATIRNKTWYRVMTGPYKTRDKATEAQKTLTSNGFAKTLIIPRKL